MTSRQTERHPPRFARAPKGRGELRDQIRRRRTDKTTHRGTPRGAPGGLRSFVARRLLLGALQTVAVVLLVFALTEALPGDAAVALAGDQPDPARIAAIREAMHLDRPVHERLADWAVGLLHGDFGTSLASGRPVGQYIADGFGPTLLLAALTVALLVPIGFGLGVLAARHEGGLVDRLISSLTLAVYAVPEFALGVLLVTVFALKLGWLPPTAVGYGTDLLAHPAALVLPVLVLLSRPVCSLVRLVRAGMVDALASPYVAHARRCGVPGARVRYTHALPGALAPATQQLARTIDWLLCGVIVVEALYVIPGLGTVLLNAVAERDVPVVQGLAVVFGVLTVVLNLGADVVARRLAPRAGVAA